MSRFRTPKPSYLPLTPKKQNNRSNCAKNSFQFCKLLFEFVFPRWFEFVFPRWCAFEFVDVALTCIGEVATVLCVALPACREQQWKSPFDEDGDAGDDGGGDGGGVMMVLVMMVVEVMVIMMMVMVMVIMMMVMVIMMMVMGIMMMVMVARYGEVHLGENEQAQLYLPHRHLGPSQDDGDTREKGKDV